MTHAYAKHILSLLTTAFLILGAQADERKVLRIALVGDSTTIGNLPRKLNPDGPQLEGLMEELAVIEGLPALEVINTGKGGETAKRLLESGYYGKTIAPLEDLDYIFVRLGINDWFRCENFPNEFPAQLKEVINRLRQDHPKAVIIPSTICRFGDHEKCVEINDLIKQVAKEEKLDLFDLYTPYNKFLTENGPNTLNVRQIELDKIPAKYHEWLEPQTFRKGWGSNPDAMIVGMDDLSLDPLFGHLKAWYGDRHPNTNGYNLIAAESIKYLAPILQARIPLQELK